MNSKFLLICSCSGRGRKAIMEYDILFPNQPTPPMVKGKEAIAKLASKYNNAHLRSISKLNGNFSYYIEITESGKIVEEYDLILGKKIV